MMFEFVNMPAEQFYVVVLPEDFLFTDALLCAIAVIKSVARLPVKRVH